MARASARTRPRSRSTRPACASASRRRTAWCARATWCSPAAPASATVDAPIAATVLPISTYVAVTEPLGERLFEAVRYSGAVADTRRNGDYYRIVGDDRLMWGGRISARTSTPWRLKSALRHDILKVYPQLGAFEIDYAWSGTMAYAVHKMPQIGELAPGYWLASAFGGHGLNTTAMAGEMIARAILDGDDRWRLFSPYELVWAGGRLGRAAAQSMFWSMQLRDTLKEKIARYRDRARREAERRQAQFESREGRARGPRRKPAAPRRQRDALPRRKRAAPPPRRRHGSPRSVRVRPRRTRDSRAKREDGSPRRPGWRRWRERKPRAPPPRRRCRMPPTPRWPSQDKSKSKRRGSHHRDVVAPDVASQAEVTAAPDVEPDRGPRPMSSPQPRSRRRPMSRAHPMCRCLMRPSLNRHPSPSRARRPTIRRRSRSSRASAAPGGKRPRGQPPGRRRIPGRSFA